MKPSGKVPHRPRQHELEALSRHAFEGVVFKQHWHIRDLDTTAEYGIDQEVEVFDRGEATGLTFRVQVKGTEKPDKVGPFRDIKLKTFAYWRSLDSPVLLVLWVASSNTLYCRWVHSYDFGPQTPSGKYHRVRFTERDKLDLRMTTLREEVEVFRLLGRGGVPRPIPLAVVVDPEERRPALVYALNQYFTQAGLRSHVRITDERPTSWTARVMPDRLRLEHPAEWGSETHSNLTNYSTETASEAIASDILINLGILIAKLGATSEAIRLFRGARLDAISLNVVGTASMFAEIAHYEGATDLVFGKVLELMPRLQNEMVQDIFDGYWLTLFALAPTLSSSDIKALRKAAKRSIRTAEDAGRQGDAARLANNVSAMMKAAGAYHRVEEFLDAATRLDSKAYAERAEGFLRRGNARWHLKNLPGALEAYRSARAAGLEDKYVIPPLSDVLFDLGDYRESLDLLTTWFIDEQEVDARSILRFLVLEELVNDLELEAQQRAYDPDLFASLRDSSADDEAVRRAQISSDALDLDLWALRSEESRPLIAKWALLAFRLNTQQAWLTTIILVKFVSRWPQFTEILVDAAIEAVEVVDPANHVREAFIGEDAEDLTEFLDDLVNRAFSHERVPGEGQRINLVDGANQLVATIIFDDDGEILAVETTSELSANEDTDG